jgi:hypothetical protein
MSGADWQWIDAATPHAKLLRNGRASAPSSLRNSSADIQRAVERIERFQASVLAEETERPLVLAEIA